MKSKIHLFFLVIFFTYGINFYSQTIVSTRHNLSVSGPGTIKAVSETEICIFCHTPHNSSPRSPLWNKPDPGVTYTLYSSSTIQGNPGQPDRSSILCLSCHDGTIALGNVLSRTNDIVFVSGITTLPPGTTNLSTDLSDDHPVSFLYNSTLASQDGELADPSTLTGPVKLEDGYLECTACHDPHLNVNGDFLVVTNQYSNLCLYCHQKNFWNNSAHKTSNATWNGSGTNPWFHTNYTTVTENACENCHNPHTASSQFRLMNFTPEENNCLVCHNGNVANKNIQSELNKPYSHNVAAYNGIHDPEEPNIVQIKHVECADCHNPHAVNDVTANPPDANGFIQGVKGVNADGNPVSEIQYQYELCYRCHADSPDKPGSPTTRQIEQSNVRLEFDIGNPSYHPIEGQGANPNVPSLISPLSESSVIYCTDCHASNGSNAPAGPHGSIYPHILKYNYETADYTQESYLAYELCYQCHDRNSILNNESFSKHKKHIVNIRTPCNVCHDPHGISSSQGNTTNNTHLINFDISIVQPAMMGRLEFIDDGTFAGRCYLRCHRRQHNPKRYP
ncbi:cytochrome c nitrite reductase pentaheme subunit [bacterium BMS3Abin03]|nr:cytochrome c nitrite reductase pentaheme subunit [bacterium BMS3Abin03]